MTRKLPGLLAFAICLSLLMVACGGDTTNTGNATNAAATNTAATNSSAPTAGGDKIGVTECDDYIAKYEACVNSKVPEAMRATVRAQLDTARNSWRQLASTAQGRAGLAQACKAAHDAAKQSMTAYGCSF